jgi:serine/threonine-protein kinase
VKIADSVVRVVDRIDAYLRRKVNAVKRTLDVAPVFGLVPAGGPADIFSPYVFQVGDSGGDAVNAAFDAIFSAPKTELKEGDKLPAVEYVMQGGKQVKVASEYTVVKKVNEGGMGRIYLVTDEKGSPWLAKDADFSGYDDAPVQEELLLRFKREIKVLRGIDNPHVVKIKAWEPKDLPTYYIMEPILGTDLASVFEAGIKPGKGISVPKNAVRVILEVVTGLIAFQNAVPEGEDISHRDIKPENILLEIKGGTIIRAVLIDFGIARLPGSKLTGIKQYRGTPGFTAPEILKENESRLADQRSDIYALGAVLYWMLTGHEPFDLTNASVLQRFRTEPKAMLAELKADCPGGVPKEVWEEIVFAAMAADPNERFVDYHEFKTFLEWFLSFD